MSTGCKCSHRLLLGFLDVSHSNGGLRISGLSYGTLNLWRWSSSIKTAFICFFGTTWLLFLSRSVTFVIFYTPQAATACSGVLSFYLIYPDVCPIPASACPLVIGQHTVRVAVSITVLTWTHPQVAKSMPMQKWNSLQGGQIHYTHVAVGDIKLLWSSGCLLFLGFPPLLISAVSCSSKSCLET